MIKFLNDLNLFNSNLINLIAVYFFFLNCLLFPRFSLNFQTKFDYLTFKTDLPKNFKILYHY